MKLLLETLVAGGLILTSCASTPKAEQIIEQKMEKTIELKAETLEQKVDTADDYQRGIQLKNMAGMETDPIQKRELYDSAANAFWIASLKRNNTYDAIIEYADCLSQSGDFEHAFEWIDKALYLQKNARAHDLKGLIYARKVDAKKIDIKNEDAKKAEDSFTDAIAIEDTAQYRWHRFQARLRIAVKENTYFEKALEDIKKVTEQKPQEPDGYIFTSSVYGAMMMTRDKIEYARESYFSLKKAIELIDAGKQTRFFSLLEIDNLRSTYKTLQKAFEPLKATFEEENH